MNDLITALMKILFVIFIILLLIAGITTLTRGCQPLKTAVTYNQEQGIVKNTVNNQAQWQVYDVIELVPGEWSRPLKDPPPDAYWRYESDTTDGKAEVQYADGTTAIDERNKVIKHSSWPKPKFRHEKGGKVTLFIHY